MNGYIPVRIVKMFMPINVVLILCFQSSSNVGSWKSGYELCSTLLNLIPYALKERGHACFFDHMKWI